MQSKGRNVFHTHKVNKILPLCKGVVFNLNLKGILYNLKASVYNLKGILYNLKGDTYKQKAFLYNLNAINYKQKGIFYNLNAIL